MSVHLLQGEIHHYLVDPIIELMAFAIEVVGLDCLDARVVGVLGVCAGVSLATGAVASGITHPEGVQSVAILQGVVSREASLESVLDDLVGKVTMSDWLLPFSKITT
jgi:hypothetical protein